MKREEKAALDRLMAGVTRNEPIQCGPPWQGVGHGGDSARIRLSLRSLSLLMKLPLSTTLHHSDPENRFPCTRGENSVKPSANPVSRYDAEKNDPLLGPASDQTEWKRSLNTGSRKHCVSKFHFFLSLARHSRGQVYRDFINSPLSVANALPTVLSCKLLIPDAVLRGAQAVAGCFAPRGVAW